MSLYSNLIGIIYPKKCAGCATPNSYFCTECLNSVVQTELICPQCFKPSIGGFTHSICKKPYGLDGLWSYGLYRQPLKNSIQKLKYKWVTEHAGILIDRVLEYWARYNPLFLDTLKKDPGNWIIIPIPLHPLRQNWRGFNQSAMLAKLIALKTGIEYCEPVSRTRNTTPQMKLDAPLRKQNVRNAFKFDGKTSITGKNILIVDDVWTTGSTLKECCFVLKRNGAKIVWALTLAR